MRVETGLQDSAGFHEVLKNPVILSTLFGGDCTWASTASDSATMIRAPHTSDLGITILLMVSQSQTRTVNRERHQVFAPGRAVIAH